YRAPAHAGHVEDAAAEQVVGPPPQRTLAIWRRVRERGLSACACLLLSRPTRPARVVIESLTRYRVVAGSSLRSSVLGIRYFAFWGWNRASHSSSRHSSSRAASS